MDDGGIEWEWSCLRSNAEVARYGAVAAYIRYYLSDAKVLDVGCGEGLLRRYLAHGSVIRYVGVDCSDVLQGLGPQPILADFHCSRIETYRPTEMFDALVFNEVLYYLADPAAVLVRYAQYLEPRGIVLVSMYDNIRSPLMTKKVDDAWQATTMSSFTLLDQFAITNMEPALTWRIRVLRKAV